VIIIAGGVPHQSIIDSDSAAASQRPLITAVAEPVTIPWAVLQAGGPPAQAAVASAFGRVGLGIILVSFTCDDAAADSEVVRPQLSSWRTDLYSYIRHTGSCLEGDYDARLVMLRAAGLGTDVPQKRSTAEGKPRSSRPAARDTEQPVVGTFSGTHQVKWNPSDPFAHGPPSAGAEDSSGGVAESIRGLSLLMARTCRAVAHACDEWLGSSPDGVEPKPTPEQGAATGALMPAGGGPGLSAGLLESALTASGAAKARLIHYKSAAQCRIGPASHGGELCPGTASAAAGTAAACEESRRAGGQESSPASAAAVHPADLGLKGLGDWQGWHYDYGLFTALTGPSYTLEAPEEGTAANAEPTGTSAARACTAAQLGARTPLTASAAAECMGGACGRCRRMADAPVSSIYHSTEDAARFGGLVVLAPRAARDPGHPAKHGSGAASASADAAGRCAPAASADWVPFVVHIPPGCIAVQVGEAAQILSGGRLVATPHCVMRPPLHQHGSVQAGEGGTASLAGSAGSIAASAAEALEHSPLPQDVPRISRQIFVLFMQPAWQATMRPPTPGAVTKASSAFAVGGAGCEAVAAAVAAPLANISTCLCASAAGEVLAASAAATAALGGLVPPLAHRWRMSCNCPGCGCGCCAAAGAGGEASAVESSATSSDSTTKVSATRERPAASDGDVRPVAQCRKPPRSSPASGAALTAVSAPYTFADFSKATTQQYYGAGGSQRR
jgi:hypothetical protein